MRVAHALKNLPLTREAFRGGRLSYSKARAITRVATPGNENVLVDIALHGTAAHVERAVSGYRRVKRLEALKAENRRHAVRELHWSSDPEACVVLRGRFTPEEAAVIRQALESAMDQIHEERKDVSAETPEAEQPASPAPLPAIPGLRGTSASLHNDALPSPVAARRADALVRMAEAWLSGGEGAGSSADRSLVNVHTDIETLKADGTGAEAEIEDGGHVSAETSASSLPVTIVPASTSRPRLRSRTGLASRWTTTWRSITCS